MNQKIYVAIKTFNSKKIHEDCLSCGNNIEHPLCPNCIAKGFKQWIKQLPQDEAIIKRRLDKFLNTQKYLNGKSKKCVACGKNNTHTCPYCFTEYLYKIIKEAGLGVRAMAEFLFIFNFDFNHKGYSKELEVYGEY